MTLIAHAVIEVPVDAEDPTQGVTRYERGDAVPEDLDGIEELREAGSVSEEDYDPAADVVGPPNTIVIDGVTYTKQESDDDA